MAIRFRVGQLANLTHLSKQTLIYYDKEGVFCPNYVDPDNGYRYYTADQLEVLDSILILKEIGLSLSEIRDFMKERCQENTLATLQKQHGRLTAKIETLSLIAGRLNNKIKTLEHFHESCSAPEWLFLPEQKPLLVQAVPAPGGLLEVDLSLKKLFHKAQHNNCPHFYQIGTMIAAKSLLEGRFLEAAYTFFPLEESVYREVFYQPAGWYLRCFHKGPYEKVGTTYQLMLDYLKEKGAIPSGFSYEYCILDSLTTKDSDEYVTELYLPVSAADETPWQQDQRT